MFRAKAKYSKSYFEREKRLKSDSVRYFFKIMKKI